MIQVRAWIFYKYVEYPSFINLIILFKEIYYNYIFIKNI